MFAFNKDKPCGDLRTFIMLQFPFVHFLFFISFQNYPNIIKIDRSQTILKINNTWSVWGFENTNSRALPQSHWISTSHGMSRGSWISVGIAGDFYHPGSLHANLRILKTCGGLWHCLWHGVCENLASTLWEAHPSVSSPAACTATTQTSAVFGPTPSPVPHQRLISAVY